MNCPGCRAPDPEPLWRLGDRLFRTTQDRFDLWRCSGCDLVFLAPVPSDEVLASYYPEGYWVGPADADVGVHARLVEFYRRLVLRDHVRFVRRVIEAQQQRGVEPLVLDMGCGDGSFLDALGFEHCVGSDTSMGAMRAANARGLASVRAGFGASPFRPGSFTLVTMFHFLEHVSPVEPHLEAARRLLAPGGEVVLQVPNCASWQARLLGRYWAGYDVPRHLVDYSARTLRETLERHGWEVVRESHYSLRDNATTLANSLAPSLYPPARVARQGLDVGFRGPLADLAYLAITLAALPFTLIESLFGRGAAVMVHVRPAASRGKASAN